MAWGLTSPLKPSMTPKKSPHSTVGVVDAFDDAPHAHADGATREQHHEDHDWDG